MKLIRSVHQVAAALACVGLMSGAAVQAQSVSVSSIVEHPALDAIKDGVHKALTDAGYNEASGFKWQFQTAQGNPAIAARRWASRTPAAVARGCLDCAAHSQRPGAARPRPTR